MSKRQTPRRPRDVNELAAHIGRIATGEITEPKGPRPATNATKRGQARAAALSPARRKAIAKKAAAARWKNKGRS